MADDTTNKDQSGPVAIPLVPLLDASDYMDAYGCFCQGTMGQGSGGSCGCGTENGKGAGS